MVFLSTHYRTWRSLPVCYLLLFLLIFSGHSMELPKVIVTSSRSLYSEYFLHHSCRFISTGTILIWHWLLYRYCTALDTATKYPCRIRIRAFCWILIQIQVFGDKTFFKNFIFSEKKVQYFYSLAIMKGFKLQEKPPVLEREHPALQAYNLLIFLSLCLPGSGFSIRIRNHRPSWSGSEPKPFYTVGYLPYRTWKI